MLENNKKDIKEENKEKLVNYFTKQKKLNLKK